MRNKVDKKQNQSKAYSKFREHLCFPYKLCDWTLSFLEQGRAVFLVLVQNGYKNGVTEFLGHNASCHIFLFLPFKV